MLFPGHVPFPTLLYIGAVVTALGHGIGALKFLDGRHGRRFDLAGYVLRAIGFSLAAFGIYESALDGSAPSGMLALGWSVVAVLAVCLVIAVCAYVNSRRDDVRGVPQNELQKGEAAEETGTTITFAPVSDDSGDVEDLARDL